MTRAVREWLANEGTPGVSYIGAVWRNGEWIITNAVAFCDAYMRLHYD